MFCKVPFTSLMGTLGCNMGFSVGFRYSCLIFLQLGGLGICQGIGMNGSCGGPDMSRHWDEWLLQGASGFGLLDTSGKYHYRTYLKKNVVTTTDNNGLSCSFYLRLHPFHFHLNLNAFFEGGIFIVSLIVTISSYFCAFKF